MVKAAAALILGLWLALPSLAAQPSPRPVKPAKPDWHELAMEHRQILAPLESDWSQFDTRRRQKWVAIAKRYPKLKPASQKLLQKRMQEWARLTPEQRRIARDRYLRINQLSDEERSRLAEQYREYRRTLAQPETPFDPVLPETETPENTSEQPASGSK